MKSFLFFLIPAAMWAQSSPPPAPVPPPTAAPALAADTVVATFENGRKITAGELTSFLAAMPPNMAQAAQRDRKAFVQQFAMMHLLSEMAEKAKLDQQSPTREALAFNRMYLLMNAQLHEVLTALTVPQEEVDRFYSENKERFKQVRVKAIYIPFAAKGDPGDAKKPTEAEAQAKIAGLRAQIAAGADFVKLVKENSGDPTSVARDGDFGTLRSTDKLPEAIRNAVFALKTGEVSAPVKQPNGFYIFRAEEVSPLPLADVHDEVLNDLKQVHFKQWMDAAGKDLNLKIENESFFAGSAPAAAGK